jgi:hypothetical protein
MNRLLALAIVLASLSVSACGNSTPSAPTTSTQTAAITPTTSALAINQMQTYTLTATPTPTTVTWVSSNTNTLTIDGGGTATAVGVGASTITATGDAGQTATLTVQTVPIYQGNWIGNAIVLACTDLAGYTTAGYCAKNLGTTQQVTLTLNQSGLVISGTMTKVEGANILSGPVTGATGINGDITLTGKLSGITNGTNVVLSLISWNSISDGTVMTGSWSGNITSDQILGMATVQYSLRATPTP